MRWGVQLAVSDPPRPPTSSRSASRARRPSAAPQRLRVLVADDYEDARAMFAEYLCYSGFDVELATDGQEAVQLAARDRFDVVLMDLAMPTLDGTAALRRLRENPRTAEIPVVACTGQIEGRQLEDARRAGFDAMILKPVVLEDLVRTLRRVAERAK